MRYQQRWAVSGDAAKRAAPRPRLRFPTSALMAVQSGVKGLKQHKTADNPAARPHPPGNRLRAIFNLDDGLEEEKADGYFIPSVRSFRRFLPLRLGNLHV